MFEHALRIRVKENRPSAKSVTPTTSDAASTTTAENAESEDTGTETTPAGEESSTPPPSEPTKEDGPSKPDSNTNENLIGKINNLISSDLNNIVELTGLPALLVYAPLKAVLSVWFLFALLGWRYGDLLHPLF